MGEIKRNMNLKDGIIGLAIGDALGVPAEFKPRHELKRFPIIDMIESDTYNLPKGTWSDDTSMTLATIDSIITTKTIDENDIATKFLDWFRNSKYTATNKTFDIGRTTLQALAKFELQLEKASNCGGKSQFDNGNGSLMRILPIGYYIFYKKIKDSKKIYDIIKTVSSITHAHQTSILGCYIYVNFIIELLKKQNKMTAYENIKKINYNFFNKEELNKYKRILNSNIFELKEEDISSSGYIVSTLEAALWVFLNSKEYNTSIIQAVNLGDDADTVGAITGSLLGIYYGIDNIKNSWKHILKRHDYITNLCDQFDKEIGE